MNNLKKAIWLISLILFITLTGFFGGWLSGASQAAVNKVSLSEDSYTSLRPLIQSMSLIKSGYVDEKMTDTKRLIYGAIKGMVEELDPYSQFMDPQSFKDMRQDTKGAFGGLGIEIAIRNSQLTIVSPIDGTPAYRAGVQPGDEIMKIDGESTENINIMDAVHKMRGKKGTKCVITIRRQGLEEWIDIPIIRDIIKIQSVRYHMLEGQIGYIRLTEFMERTGKDFEKALRELEKDEMKGLILDLRNNPGGLLTMAAEISEYFVPQGKKIVYTKGRRESQDITFFSQKKRAYSGKPLVVVVNQGSASASEIVAGAIQDWGLGIIVGEKTFGKGSVQTIIPLGDGSALRMTTARYLTPKGQMIHGNGIKPDLTAAQYRPNQLSLTLSKDGKFEKFAPYYLKLHPQGEEKEEKHEDVEVSEKSWKKLKPKSPDEKLMSVFEKWLKENEVDFNQYQLVEDMDYILVQLRSEIARKLEGAEAARKVKLEGDPQIQRAKDALNIVEMYKKEK